MASLHRIHMTKIQCVVIQVIRNQMHESITSAIHRFLQINQKKHSKKDRYLSENVTGHGENAKNKF